MKNPFYHYPYFYKLYRKQKLAQGKSPIKYYNFWPSEQDYWFSRFIDHYKLNPKNRNLSFLSVFGHKEVGFFTKNPRIFYTGENVMYGNNPFEDHYKKSVALAMGFIDSDAKNYLRFPFWILRFLDPEADFEALKQKILKINAPEHRQNPDRTKFACHIARHDNNGLRGKMVDDLSQIARVDNAGKFRNNTQDLFQKFEDDKIRFMQQYKFNICPENTDTEGYVTEKPFEAIEAGCIPIYWGSGNNPEPDILNPKTLLFYNESGNNEALLKVIKQLHEDTAAYREFTEIPPLLPGAEDKIWSMLQEFKIRLTRVLK